MDIRRAYVEYHDKAIAVEAHLPTDGTNIQDKMISIVIWKINQVIGTTINTTFGLSKILLSMISRNIKSNSNDSTTLSRNGINEQSRFQECF